MQPSSISPTPIAMKISVDGPPAADKSPESPQQQTDTPNLQHRSSVDENRMQTEDRASDIDVGTENPFTAVDIPSMPSTSGYRENSAMETQTDDEKRDERITDESCAMDDESDKENEENNGGTDEDQTKGVIWYHCETVLCPYKSKRTGNLTRHFQKLHTKLETEITCCDISFATKFEFGQHDRECHPDGKYSCATCLKDFKKKALLRRHDLVHNRKNELQCENCTYETDHVSNMSRHCISRKHVCSHEKLAKMRSRINSKNTSDTTEESTESQTSDSQSTESQTTSGSQTSESQCEETSAITPPLTPPPTTSWVSKYKTLGKESENKEPTKARRRKRPSKKDLSITPPPTPPHTSWVSKYKTLGNESESKEPEPTKAGRRKRSCNGRPSTLPLTELPTSSSSETNITDPELLRQIEYFQRLGLVYMPNWYIPEVVEAKPEQEIKGEGGSSSDGHWKKRILRKFE